VISLASSRFWKAFEQLPERVQSQAREAYKLWQKDPYHESLQFKCVHTKRRVFSVRIGLHWRAVGVMPDDTITWFWIGSHSDYDKLIASL
jgi:hypothetical protein